MELLAGDDDMIAETRESGCLFRFDFSKVYWNSRLQGEHDRLVKFFKPGEFICDGFAGVGPFALPAGKKGCVVFANDLNPTSYQYLCENIIANKLQGTVRAFNMDGRDFIQQSISELNDELKWQSFLSQKSKPTLTRAKRSTNNVLTSEEKESEGDKEKINSDESTVSAAVVNKFRHFHHYVMNLPANALEFL
ncbi:tRNA(m(1)G37)methyltransferase, partial [Nowakowskiella sp. JEL0078]